jgi:hypothetical protein
LYNLFGISFQEVIFVGKRRDRTRLIVSTTIPDITPEERSMRVERFVDAIARIAEIEGYAGCKYFPEKERGEIYIAK